MATLSPMTSFEERASSLDKILLRYVNRLFHIASSRPVEFEDLGSQSNQDSSAEGMVDLLRVLVLLSQLG